MDKRSAVRVDANGQVNGKMILVETLEIMDISLTGIRFRSMRRLDMNIPHRIRIEKQGVSIRLKGSIVRATFKGLHQAEDKSLPVYEVAMHFDAMSDNDRKSLEKLVSILSHE
jgi:c-di-GMP-binding flagellar brake protein YcgR